LKEENSLKNRTHGKPGEKGKTRENMKKIWGRARGGRV